MYKNINMMYDIVLQAMVDCSSARSLDKEEVNAVLEHPDYCLYTDECGINMN
jgi:hypothetical protein